MELYNLKDDLVAETPYIITDKGTLYTKFLDDKELKELGYLKVSYKDYPANVDEFKKACSLAKSKETLT